MTILSLLPEGDPARAIVVWPNPVPLAPGDIQEARDHYFELTGAADAANADLLIDEEPLEALRVRGPGRARWRWTPGFQAGSVECQLALDGRRYAFELVTDPSVRKLTRDDFDVMLKEILEDSLALFSLTSFRKGVARGAGDAVPPIARLEFFRSRIGELERVIASIDAAPRRVLRPEEIHRPPHLARGATGPEVLASFRSGRLLRAESPERLPKGLQGMLPARIRMRRRRSSLDIAEHRQMKACLASWADWLDRAAIMLTRRTRLDGDPQMALWARRSKRLTLRLRRLLSLPLFAEVGDALPRPIISPLWRGDHRYRRFMELWRDLSLGLARVFGDFLQMPLARTFELYELWCFLRLLRAASERHGAGADIGALFVRGADGVTLATGALAVAFPAAGFTLCFQRRYREFWVEADQRGSFSREMQPDIVIDMGSAGSIVVLDAKYRIGSDLQDAISSAHMYRDALVTPNDGEGVRAIVSAAYLLSPAVGPSSGDWREAPLPGRLFHPEYRSTFRFGALTLRPKMKLAAVGDALDLLLRDAGVLPEISGAA